MNTRPGKAQADLISNVNGHDADPLLNLTTIARALGKHPTTIARWVDDGILPFVKIGPLRKVRKSSLEKILASSAMAENTEISIRVKQLREQQ